MNAGLAAHRAVRARSSDLEDRLFDAVERSLGEREHLDLPALTLNEAGVHAVQIGREQRRLVAAGAGADLDDGVALVERILRDECRLQLGLERLDGRLEASDFGARFGGQLGVVNGNELARLRELVLLLSKTGSQLDERSQPPMFAA
jgi:hypothetical protein